MFQSKDNRSKNFCIRVTVTLAILFAWSLITIPAYAQNIAFYEQPLQNTELHAIQYDSIAPTTESLEKRIAALESQIAKKQDKPAPTNKWTNKMAGRVYFDGYSFADQDTAGGAYTNQGNIVSLREFRLSFSGEGYNLLDYRAEFGVGAPPKSNNSFEDSIGIQDVYLGVKNVPIFDYVKFGHYKPETGLAYLQSANNTTAMEFVNASALMSYGRRLGISSAQHFAEDRVRWFNGFFGDEAGRFSTNKYYNNDRQGYMFNSRLTILPYYCNEGRYYLHLGANYSYLDLAENRYTINVKPGNIANSDAFMSLNFPTDHVSSAGFEFAYNLNRLGTQCELFLQDTNLGHAYGGYAEVRYMLSNAYRSYDKKNAAIGNIEMPAEKYLNIIDCNGLCCPQSWGAWEAFGQLSYVDYTNYVNGCRSSDLTLGLNWFWNPQTRMIFEYIHSKPTWQSAKGSTDTLGMSMRFFF